jgi:hypothetical protein
MKGKIAAVCSAAAMAMFGSVALAAPAHAANHIEACFALTNGAPYAGGHTELHVLTGPAWEAVAQSDTDANGCIGYDIYGATQAFPAHIYAYTAQIDPNTGNIMWIWDGYTPDAPAGPVSTHYYTPMTITCTSVMLPCPAI